MTDVTPRRGSGKSLFGQSSPRQVAASRTSEIFQPMVLPGALFQRKATIASTMLIHLPLCKRWVCLRLRPKEGWGGAHGPVVPFWPVAMRIHQTVNRRRSEQRLRTCQSCLQTGLARQARLQKRRNIRGRKQGAVVVVLVPCQVSLHLHSVSELATK